MKTTIKKVGNFLAGDSFSKGYSAVILAGYAALLVASPAQAQSLRATGESVFNVIYGLVGVIGGICILLSAINWKAGGIIGNNPKKYFIDSLIGTAIGFGVVGIVQAIKAYFATSGSISGV